MSTPATLDRSTFLSAASRFRRRPVTIDGLGTVYVRELSAGEAKEFHKRQEQAEKAGGDAATGPLAWLAILVTYADEATPTPLLTAADTDAVRAFPIRILSQVSEAAAAASKHGDDAAKKPDSGS